MFNLATGAKLRGISLTDNVGLITAFGNDTDYSEVFSGQLEAIMDEGDLLVAVSGSGNSPNIVRALEAGKKIGMRTYAILGYTGGSCKDLADVAIHFPIEDMQISEDLQLIVGHMCMQWLWSENTKE